MLNIIPVMVEISTEKLELSFNSSQCNTETTVPSLRNIASLNLEKNYHSQSKCHKSYSSVNSSQSEDTLNGEHQSDIRTSPRKNRFVKRNQRLRDKHKSGHFQHNDLSQCDNVIKEKSYGTTRSSFQMPFMDIDENRTYLHTLKKQFLPLRHTLSSPVINDFVTVQLQKHKSDSELCVSKNKCCDMVNLDLSNCLLYDQQQENVIPLACDIKASSVSDDYANDGKQVQEYEGCNKMVDISWKAQHSRSKSDGSGVLETKAFPNEIQVSIEGVLSSSLPNVLSGQALQKDMKKKSLLEGGAVIAPTECFFPRPQPGQTLLSFLKSGMDICAELDRENAHFCISEALISAFEQIRCTETLKYAAEEAESDEEIKKLNQRIRIRRRERLQEKAARTSAFSSDGRTDTTSESVSPMSSSHSSEFYAGDSVGSDEEDIADVDLSDHTASNLKSVKESGLSLSLASMYSDADIQKVPFVQAPADLIETRSDVDPTAQLSAEAVALSLLKRFSEKQLPKASDLQWLVSEQEVPQALLPLPDSWPVSPDIIEEECGLEQTRLRGNLEWAPPRQQIIFMIHPEPKKKDAILKQNYRCAGCGMKVERNYARKFRYCDYLGKFFCQCCHANDIAYIPGRILWKWDFRQYYVSKFSWKLLDQMFYDPLFNMMDINNKMYRKIRQLELCREYRTQLFYLKDFIRTCRNAEQMQREFEQLPEHLINDPHSYSISDFARVKNGELSRVLYSFVTKSSTHVLSCILCQAKGFICENCNRSEDVIFPFQHNKVCLCDACGSCFHKRCFKPGACPKCMRILERKRKSMKIGYSDEEL